MKIVFALLLAAALLSACEEGPSAKPPPAKPPPVETPAPVDTPAPRAEAEPETETGTDTETETSTETETGTETEADPPPSLEGDDELEGPPEQGEDLPPATPETLETPDTLDAHGSTGGLVMVTNWDDARGDACSKIHTHHAADLRPAATYSATIQADHHANDRYPALQRRHYMTSKAISAGGSSGHCHAVAESTADGVFQTNINYEGANVHLVGHRDHCTEATLVTKTRVSCNALVSADRTSATCRADGIDFVLTFKAGEPNSHWEADHGAHRYYYDATLRFKAGLSVDRIDWDNVDLRYCKLMK